MGGDGSNIRPIYIADEQPLVFPQIVKKRMYPMRGCVPLSRSYLRPSSTFLQYTFVCPPFLPPTPSFLIEVITFFILTRGFAITSLTPVTLSPSRRILIFINNAYCISL